MTQALRISRKEHRNLAALLSCLTALVREADERGYLPEFEVVEQMLDYLSGFLNRFHHPKESEHLFDALLRRRPECADLVGALGREHGKDGPQLDGLRRCLDACRTEGQAAVPALRAAVEAYCRFELDHMAREEDQIFEQARQNLTAEDWRDIDAAFLANDDPLFGAKRRREFSDLFSRIVAMTPAPYGLGPSSAE